ncbi:hypothetical protein ASJ81_04490 [Methanosarcina spelaei]|uniref:eCIS core domain-containing protein n=1 Tax=Methanosarcina spelaei TaxID=1036679 RepID=A0A2A2HUM8_9EURY|nr:DUF4157 domain-containing protein [Methanosarcina spelaei]PAV12990.1 hypothetical protein ASJ81_04490 [Methanosarcina spelaei]
MHEHSQIQLSKNPESSPQRRSILTNQIHISSPADIIQRARINPKSLASADVLQLQRTIGNRAVRKLFTEIGLIPFKSKQEHPIQVQTISEEEKKLFQGKMAETVQCKETPEEGELLQEKFKSRSEQEKFPSCSAVPIQMEKENHTGMPDNLKAGVEGLSGIDMSDVRVHYNSDKPTGVGALAYTQGVDIHVAPGQEKHLPHDAWHVVQQKQGRVKYDMQMKDTQISSDVYLEKEADLMGLKALQKSSLPTLDQVSSVQSRGISAALPSTPLIMRKIGFEYEVGAIETHKYAFWSRDWVPHKKGEVIVSRNGYDITADISQSGSQLEFITRPIDEVSDSAQETSRTLAQNIRADILAIFQASRASPQGWVGLDKIPRLNGSSWHQFYNKARRWDGISGQLQMTGGVKLEKLSRVLSGEALGREPAVRQALASGETAAKEREILTLYYKENFLRKPNQLIWRSAFSRTRSRFRKGWDIESIKILASIVALMAQIPIDKRNSQIEESRALLLAKTDYAKILQLVATHLGQEIKYDQFLLALIETINDHVTENEAVNGNSDVFPSNYAVQGTSFTGLTLKAWVEYALPIHDPFEEKEFIEGWDLLTGKHFPGTGAQRKEMRAFGTFLGKTDPGNKVILEWRSFMFNHPDDLDKIMVSLTDYLGRRVNG